MRLLLGLAAAAMLVAVSSPATAHNMTVTHPNTGEVLNTQWIAGQPLPTQADGKGLFPHPPSGGTQSAGHREGLPNACEATAANSAVSILAPPFFTGCVHGQR